MTYKPSDTNVTLYSTALNLGEGKPIYLVLNGKKYITECYTETPYEIVFYAGKEVKDYAVQGM